MVEDHWKSYVRHELRSARDDLRAAADILSKPLDKSRFKQATGYLYRASQTLDKLYSELGE